MSENIRKSNAVNMGGQEKVQYRRAKKWEIILGMANNGTDVAFYLLMGFASMIAVEGYGIAMVVAGVLLTVMRILFGTMDAVISGIFEKFNPRRGKIQIFMLLGWLCCTCGAMFLYNLCAGRFEGIVGFLVFVLSYLIFLVGYSINTIGGGTVGIVITNDPAQRALAGVAGTVFSYAVPLIFTNITTFIILPKYDYQYNTAMFGEMVLWYAVISLVFVLLTCIGIYKVDVRETFISSKGARRETKVSVRDMWAVIKENRNVQIYMLTGVANKLAQQTGTQSVILTLLNGVLIGSYAASTIVSNFTQIVGILFVFSGGIFIAKWGSKRTTIVWSWISTLIAGFTIGFCLLLGGPEGMKKIGVVGIPICVWAVLQLAKSGATMILTTTNQTMKADVVDDEYDRSGNYLPAIVSGIYSFVDKLVSSLGSTIAAVAVTFVGYINSIPQLGDEATWPRFWMCMFLAFGLPMLGWICNIIAMRFYNLDRERMVEIQKHLSQK